MKLQLKKGTTGKRIFIAVLDSSSVTGAMKTGLVAANLTCSYSREDDGNTGATTVSLAGGTRGTWSSGGFVEKDPVNAKGDYELGIPDAALASGSNVVTITLQDAGSNNVAPVKVEIQLVDYDPQDAVRLGLTALPTEVPGQADGLLIAGINVGATQFNSLNVYAGLTITGGVTVVGTIALQDGFSIAGGFSVAGPVTATHGSNDFRINGKVPGAADGLHVLGDNVGDTTYNGAIIAANAANDLRINGKVPGTTNGLHIVGDNLGDTTYTGLTSHGMQYRGANGYDGLQGIGTGNGTVGIRGISGAVAGGAGIAGFANNPTAKGISASSASFGDVTITSLANSGNTTLTGIVVAINQSNDIQGVSLKDGSIKESTIDPTIAIVEDATVGIPTGLIGKLARVVRFLIGPKTVRNRATGKVSVRNNADTATLQEFDHTTNGLIDTITRSI